MDRPDVEAIVTAFRADLSAAEDLDGLEEVRRRHFGKKSAVKSALNQIGRVPAEERKSFAQTVNEARTAMEGELEARLAEVERATLERELESEWQDLSLPGSGVARGARHPIAVVERRCMEVMRRLGFTFVDGPEVESAYYNFDALNIPEHHPARDLQDTFWVDGGLLLRSHTTTVQARVLEQRPPLPIRVASMGRVYRNEAVDATHTAMFHQFEGIWIDEGLTFAQLKGVLAFIARELFDETRRIRFKPKFYPYTEPSAGVDLSCFECDGAGCDSCHHAGWVTILGAGMVHPRVFIEFGYDPREVSGIAFGLGTTRMAAQGAGVHKSRTLYEQDLRVHQNLNRGAQ